MPGQIKKAYRPCQYRDDRLRGATLIRKQNSFPHFGYAANTFVITEVRSVTREYPSAVTCGTRQQIPEDFLFPCAPYKSIRGSSYGPGFHQRRTLCATVVSATYLCSSDLILIKISFNYKDSFSGCQVLFDLFYSVGRLLVPSETGKPQSFLWRTVDKAPEKPAAIFRIHLIIPPKSFKIKILC